jgi:hypothetical protein
MNLRLQEQLEAVGQEIAQDDRADIDDNGSKSKEQLFEQHVRELKALCRDLPHEAIEAIYHDHRGEDWIPRTGFGTQDDWEDIHRAEQRGFVTVSSDNRVEIAHTHPKVRKALDKLSDLNYFMANDAGEEFSSEFEDENEYPFDLSNRDFWSNKLGL